MHDALAARTTLSAAPPRLRPVGAFWAPLAVQAYGDGAGAVRGVLRW